MAKSKRGRKAKQWKKNRVVTFRLTEPEFQVLRFYAQHITTEGETFSDTLARIVRNLVVKGAISQLEFVRSLENPSVTMTRDKAREDLRRAACVVKKTVEDGVEQPEKYPTLTEQAMKGAFSRSGFASPPVVASLASVAAHTPRDESGEPTAKTQNLASPIGSAGQRPAESAGKIEDFSEDLVNSGFSLGGGLDKLS